jgi:FkbM family methyltransferase
MTARTGVGRSYRDLTWLERLGARLRSAVSGTAWHRPLRVVFRSTLGWLAADRLVATLPGGERVRLLPEHRQLAWNAEEYAAFKAAVVPGATVLDVGANLGAYTVLFAQWVGPRGRVFAFEPAPGSRSGLSRQLALNGVEPRVQVRPEAVAGASGVRSFHADGVRGDNRLVTSDDSPGAGCVEVPTTSIDEFCQGAGIEPDVMKIDVEGAELDVLRGARRTIARRGSRLAVFVELHPRLWPRSGVSRQDIETELDAQGLTIERIDERGDPWAIEGVCVRVRQRCAS